MSKVNLIFAAVITSLAGFIAFRVIMVIGMTPEERQKISYQNQIETLKKAALGDLLATEFDSGTNRIRVIVATNNSSMTLKGPQDKTVETLTNLATKPLRVISKYDSGAYSFNAHQFFEQVIASEGSKINK